MNLKEAIEFVLQEMGGAMSAEEITQQILRRGLWKTNGKTPSATVGASIYTDIKKNGERSRFVKTCAGKFSLRNSVLVSAIGQPILCDEFAQVQKQNQCEMKKGRLKTGKIYSFTDSAEKVLLENKKPMHYLDITKVALGNGWLSTSGKTPEATMYAQIIQEIQRLRKRGEIPRFIQCGKGIVALSAWDKSGVRLQIEQHRKDIRRKLHKRMMDMNPQDFEKLVSLLLTHMGFSEVEVTSYSKDGGIDVRGKSVTFSNKVYLTEYAIQVKRWKRNVQAPDVQKVRGSKRPHEMACIITTSSFSKGAIDEAKRSDREPIILIDGEALLDLMLEHRVGVRTEPVTLFEVREDLLDDSPEVDDSEK